MSKAIVICSDGTWQKGGSGTPTNVWRVYQAVDPIGQPKFHDDGVGSGGTRVQRIIGGAFGFGISRNIRELLVFLSYTYEPEDQIYLFGFSRGAFTVRVLANLICALGIPKSEGKSPEEVETAARELLNLYKSVNQVRDQRVRTRQTPSEEAYYPDDESYASRFHLPTEEFMVHFLGCWDTVEALGVPFERLKQAVISLFPLKFRNNYASSRVRYLYHAVCLDDERATFHPILWKVPPQGLLPAQQLEQVWFPGAHAHVGGGYAKDQLALESLEWMLEKAEAAGLQLVDEVRNGFRNRAYRHGRMHASRPGLFKFYRYRPRQLSEFPASGPYKVHGSALERIAQRTEGYAPTAIDVEFEAVESAYRQNAQAAPIREVNLTELEYSKQGIASAKFHYWLCMIVVACVACIGWWNSDRDPTPILEFAEDTLAGLVGGHATQPATLIGWGFGMAYSLEHVVLRGVQAVLPSFLFELVFEGLRRTPGVLTVWAILAWMLALFGGRLRAQIAYHATRAWHPPAAKTAPATAGKREADPMSLARRWGLRFVIGVTATIVALVGWEDYHAFERNRAATSCEILAVGETTTFTFPTAAPRWDAGIELIKGANYQLTMKPDGPWHDLDKETTPEGFEPMAGQRRTECLTLSAIRRRDPTRKMFALLAAQGDDPGTSEIKLTKSTDDTFTGQLPARRSGPLFLFVNDFPGFYKNNVGTASVTIKRLP